MNEESLADQWLEAIDKAERVLNDVVAAIPELDAMERMHTRPTVGWMQRNTTRSTTTIS